MTRALAAAALSLIMLNAAAQESGRLHITVTLTGASQQPTPVPRHTLLISDNPTSAPPRAIVTGADGTADVRLRPGNYTVESDQPVVFEGHAFQWTQMVDIVAGGDLVLRLTSANAEVAPLPPATPASQAAAREPDLAVLARWQDSVVALWTPTAHASGFVVGANGLIATNQRVIAGATSVEVQLTPTVKVAARVLVADAARDVAVLRIDPGIAGALPAVPLGCADPATVKRSGQELVAIGAPLRQQKGPAFGSVDRVSAHTIGTDFVLPAGSAGGPVLTTDGALVGMTSVDEERADERRQNARVVGVVDVCDVVGSAEKKVNDGVPPSGAHLPVEPPAPFPEDILRNVARQGARSLTPYQMSSSDFDITFITPQLTYRALSSDSGNTRGPRPPGIDPSVLVTDFSNWSDYVGDIPPVLLVRVTPKLVEGFWTKVGRGAARTQGVAVPALTRPKSGFSRLRALCGDAEVTPIHPFRLEHRFSETDTIDEGLYVFDPGALGPSCGTVKLVLYSEKAPDRADTRIVDPKVIDRIWDDFAPYRALK